MNDATETIRKAAARLTDVQKEAADALLASLATLATVVKTSHEGLPDVNRAARAFTAVECGKHPCTSYTTALACYTRCKCFR